jgi:nucleotide-binding universal stress UspA family protein
MFQRILVTLDGSPHSERALAHAADIARAFGSRVTLLTVVAPDAVPLDAQALAEDEHRMGLWRRYLEEHSRAVREAGIQDVRREVRGGVPARAIVEVARELDTDLIVMSTQEVGADTEYGLGSVAAKVLASAPCPVLMVRISKPAPPRDPDEERWQSEGGANVG